MDVKVNSAGLDLSPDFKFLNDVIAMMKDLPNNENVWFPEVGSSRRALAECTYAYDGPERCAAGTFVFTQTHLGMQMAHQTQITRCTLADGKPGLRVTMIPVGKFNKKLHRAVSSVHSSVRGTVNAILINYTVGSVFRKIVAYQAPKRKIAVE